MPKRGLDPNASFRHPVDTTPAPVKILVDCVVLEILLDIAESTPSASKALVLAELRDVIGVARQAAQAHRRYE